MYATGQWGRSHIARTLLVTWCGVQVVERRLTLTDRPTGPVCPRCAATFANRRQDHRPTP